MPQIDIRNNIKVSMKLQQMYNEYSKTIEYCRSLSLWFAIEFLTELCYINNLGQLTNVGINTDQCIKLNADAFFRRPSKIYFKNSDQITFRLILHEFSHYLDYNVNTIGNRITFDNDDICNTFVADDFARNVKCKLWRMKLMNDSTLSGFRFNTKFKNSYTDSGFITWPAY